MSPAGDAAQTREVVLQVARRLFGERGYATVTIREVAAQAGVSPSMVMKVAGSKEQLYALATPAEPTPLPPDVPLEGLGELLVSRLLQRRDDEAAEPWLRALYLLVEAPDPEAARAESATASCGASPRTGRAGGTPTRRPASCWGWRPACAPSGSWTPGAPTRRRSSGSTAPCCSRCSTGSTWDAPPAAGRPRVAG
ncbi:TetR/AcrR family transcriptional regulator [Ornithinimicrobium sp. W1665]|uniref:TetR/AcrR family transcriptional regulator n=1 Tax=Ornithinimicrobium sp. W1665 TaxID=3416666 RepID=UPI003D6BE531